MCRRNSGGVRVGKRKGDSGSGEVVMEGTAAELEAEVDGSGNCNAFGLVSERAEVYAGGSGHANVNAVTAMTVEISGSGNVYYKGNPTITSTITGTGQLIDAN